MPPVWRKVTTNGTEVSVHNFFSASPIFLCSCLMYMYCNKKNPVIVVVPQFGEAEWSTSMKAKECAGGEESEKEASEQNV